MNGQEISVEHLLLFFGTVITILLSVIVFFLKRFIEDVADMKDTVNTHTTKIAVINEHLHIAHANK